MLDKIQRHVGTTLAWDNIDHQGEKLSGEGTSHRVNGVAVQARHFGPQLPLEPSTQIVKNKTRSVEALDAENLPIYHVEDGCCPRSRRFGEVTRQEALENVRLHADVSEHKVQQWRNFLLNPKSKMTLREFVVKEWRHDKYKYRAKLTGKVIFVTCESNC